MTPCPTILERDGIRFGLVSTAAYHKACHRLPCFTIREIRLLRKQAIAMGAPVDAEGELLEPLPLEIVRALCEVKTAMPESTVDDKLQDWPPSWQWLDPGSDQRALGWDLDAENR